ncbi:MAG: DUF371 domain-containing protein [Promethearchaeota archaeon]
MCSLGNYTFTLTARGHPNVRSTHQSTLEVTSDSHLSLRGDCILGVSASHSSQCVGAAIGFALRQPGSRVVTRFSVGDVTDVVQGFGSPDLTLQASSSLVWRTSTYKDDRTVAIQCDKAAATINRTLVQKLKSPSALLQVVIVVFVPSI